MISFFIHEEMTLKPIIRIAYICKPTMSATENINGSFLTQ